jgi:hypothetical protein
MDMTIRTNDEPEKGRDLQKGELQQEKSQSLK